MLKPSPSDGDDPSGTSPEQPGSDFERKSCPAGRPLRYFVFPRSELNALTTSGHNRVTDIRPFEEGIYVHTVEADGASGIYKFTREFKLKQASWSDGYRDAHHKFEREGKINHSWKQCPDRYGPRLVRLWDPEHGWTEIHADAAAK